MTVMFKIALVDLGANSPTDEQWASAHCLNLRRGNGGCTCAEVY
jgi:hypothetical protein